MINNKGRTNVVSDALRKLRFTSKFSPRVVSGESREGFVVYDALLL